jgi:hypothetical protein
MCQRQTAGPRYMLTSLPLLKFVLLCGLNIISRLYARSIESRLNTHSILLGYSFVAKGALLLGQIALMDATLCYRIFLMSNY